MIGWMQKETSFITAVDVAMAEQVSRGCCLRGREEVRIDGEKGCVRAQAGRRNIDSDSVIRTYFLKAVASRKTGIQGW